jgi:NTP pyrophosphatase (non-canonical NTP hydrolase)
MTPNEYQIQAARTLMSSSEQAEAIIDSIKILPELSQMIVGGAKLCSEAGELNDTIVKHISYGQELDHNNIIEECGDILWYVAMILTACQTTMEEAMHSNIEKLRIRYPEKFTEKDAAERKDKIECPFCGENHTLEQCHQNAN